VQQVYFLFNFLLSFYYNVPAVLSLCLIVMQPDTDRALQPGGAVQCDDVLQLLPEEQLQELPDIVHSGAVLPHLLLPVDGRDWTVNEMAVVRHRCRCQRRKNLFGLA
jgi:hypothetical protein